MASVNHSGASATLLKEESEEKEEKEEKEEDSRMFYRVLECSIRFLKVLKGSKRF